MSKFESLLFLVLLFYTPHTCQTQAVSGTPVIMATKDVLAMTVAIVKSANINATITQNNIKTLKTNLKNNGTVILRSMNALVDYVLTEFQVRIHSLGVNSGDDVVNECAIPMSFVEASAEKVRKDANSCVSDNIKSIERELNDTYSSIESIIAKINSEQSVAETCVVEYDKTEMALWNGIITALCVTQAKERILSTIENELPTRKYDAVFLHMSLIDGMKRLNSCNDYKSRLSSFTAATASIHLDILNCISN